MYKILLAIILAPLIASIVSGIFGKFMGRYNAHRVTIIAVLISFICSLYIFNKIIINGDSNINIDLYTWSVAGSIPFNIGFYIDWLTAIMLVTVTFVSLCVHVYTIGYMQEDAGYQRFFSYISLFTFAMLVLVMSNNFLQLFFGWEAVGVVSYLLIGFWYTKESAIFANLKAFLVNRLGDLGFLIGIAAIFYYFGTLNYIDIFQNINQLIAENVQIKFIAAINIPLIDIICMGLFIGAMGKSAQMPLHVWLPDSMEGPTPISALIHAATMVTAGIFMVTRMSPLFEFSEFTLSFILIIGGTTAFFMGLLGIVMNDIKKIIAYSTLSQLGIMVTALGASSYSLGVFHLFTHAFFKALLFLAAGSVIIGMHHIQDIRKMGNIKRYMPITYITSLIGSLALSGIPPFAGFFSKDLIIESLHEANIFGAKYAYYTVLLSVLITASYTAACFGKINNVSVNLLI